MPAKRRSDAVDDGDEDEVPIDSATSALRAHTHKRLRTALATDDDNDGSMSDSEGLRSPTLTTSADDEGDDLHDLQATQLLKKHLRKHPENKESEYAIIEEVRCENFMCHEKLTVKLGPLINFIIGHNGSGKSAVLTALTVCLGGKATTTNRGTSLKNMIKEGKEHAVLSVKIKNQGDQAYRPELYGKSIIVERHFSRSGKSAFRLKNAQGKVVSKMKRDLDDVIDYFAFQLDNPINVLNQDMARQFLSNSTPNDKYKFFIRGTQLETLDADYKLLDETLENLETRLQSRDEDLKVLEAAAAEAESRKKRLEASNTIRENIKITQRMHAWAQVEEEEREVEKRIQQVAIAEQRTLEAEYAAETASGLFEGAEQAHRRAHQRVEELDLEMQPTASKLGELDEKFKVGKQKLADIMANLRSAKADLKQERDTKAQLEKQIQAEHQLLADINGGGHTDRLERMRQLEQDHERAQQDLTNHTTLLAGFDQAVIAAQKTFERAQTQEKERKIQLEDEKTALSKLEQDRGQRFAGYKQRGMQQLCKLIDQERRWKAKPIGPLGLYVKMRDSKYMGLIERHLGATLDSFVVAFDEDKTLLADMMKRIKCEPSILIGNSKPMNTTSNEPAESVTTILRVLDIEETIVRNQLIIYNSIEQTVLFPDLKQANEFVNGPRPPKVKAVLAWTNNGNGDGIRLDWSRSGYKRSGPLHAYKFASRMQTNHDEQIERQKQYLQRARVNYHESEQERHRFLQDLEKARQDKVRHSRDRTEKTKQLQRISDDMEALTEEIENNRPKDGRLQELERQLNEAKANEETQSRITAELVTQRAQVDEDQRHLKALCDAARDEVNDHTKALENANLDKAEHEAKRQAALREKNRAFQTIADRKEELQDCVEARDAQQKNLDDNFIAEALKVCARIPVEPGMTPKKLDDRLTRYQEDIANAEQEAGGSIDELVNNWKRRKTAWHKAQTEYKSMKELSETLLRSLSERRERWHKFRQLISSRARSTFGYLLSERDFRGRIVMDHVNKMLDLAVEPDLTKKSNEGRSAPTLSGGEKSFSTVCLLLSIWDAMGSPIRCLDEFDVFMDSVNRAISMKMMIGAARRAVGRQFILITPQSMQNVDLGTDVAVYKMPDPERGQQALPYTQEP